MRLCVLGSMLLLLVGCGPLVPATTPPQLAFTPGPPVVVTDRVLETAEFTVHYPAGWRVVTGAADQPSSAVLVAPDETATIQIQVGALQNEMFTDNLQTDIRAVTLANGLPVTAVGRASAEHWGRFLPVFEAVILSLQSS
ncbi:MAG: hypothetical protein K8I60_20165 [Anaerolineae bacterium]|nr:hypothetical protein [Anaerolineae bacterium]